MHHSLITWYRVALACLATVLIARAPLTAQEPAKGKGVAAILQPFVEQKSLAGAVVLVANKDKVLEVDAVGYANIEDNTLMGPSALFWIASMNKPITAAALMLLVDEGKVSLDDAVEKYLPEFKDVMLNGQRLKKSITVRQLLSHTSGLAFKSPEEAPTLDVLTLKEAVASYVKMPLAYEPGTKYVYSNAGINSAGRIIEVVSGMSFETFLDKRLFEPLGMKDTTYWPSAEQVKRLATGYKPNAAKKGLEPTRIVQLKYPLSDRKRQPMPGGGLFSTASDVGRFCQMVLGGGVYQGKRVLSEKAVQEMTRRQTPDNVKVSYGLGWAVAPDGFGHGGAMATNMWLDSKRGLITVFMVQHVGFPGDGAKSLTAFRKAAEEKYAGQ